MCIWYEKDWAVEKHNNCAENLTKKFAKSMIMI